MTNEDLTRLYNAANGIPEGKAPPITTERIFTAMRAIAQMERTSAERQCRMVATKYALTEWSYANDLANVADECADAIAGQP